MRVHPERSQDRRPIASRNAHWAIALTALLAGKGVSANAISVLGMLACTAGGVALAMTSRNSPDADANCLNDGDRWLWLLAGVMCQLRLVCNLLDGMVAIARGIASPVGALYNELPDRASDIAVLVGLGYAAMGNPTLGWLCSLLAVLTAYVRAAVKVAGSADVAQDFCGPMAKQHRMALVTALSVFMAIAPSAWRGPIEAGWTAAWTVPQLVMALMAVGCVLTILRRIARGASALREMQRGSA